MSSTNRQIRLLINGQEVAANVKQISDEKKKLSAEIRKMVVGSEQYEDTVKRIAQLSGSLREHRSRLNGIEESYSRLTKLGATLAGAAGAAFAVDQIIAYGAHLFKLSSQMELLGKKADTVFRQALPAVTAAARENAAAMGLSTAQYVDAAVAIGDLLIPMGFQREEAAKVSVEMTNLAGALAEWTGGQFSAQEVTQSLSKALLGEREELERYGISIKQSELNARLAAEGLDKLTGNALKQAEAMTTLRLIMEKSTDAQAGFAAGSDTMARRQAELSAKLTEISERLAVALVPIFERLATVAANVVDLISGITNALGANATATNKASEGVAKLQTQFNLEIETLKRGNLSQDARAKLIEQINTRYGQYLPNLIKETDSVQQLAEAQNAANRAFSERITMMAAQEKLVEVNRQLIEAKTEELRLQIALTKAAQEQQAQAGSGEELDSFYSSGNLIQAQQAVDKNKALQSELQQSFQETMSAAAELGVNITQALGGGTSADSPTPGAGARKAVDKTLEELKRLQEALAGFQEEARITAMDEDDQAIERVRQRYAKEITLAEELERKGMRKATDIRLELERLRDDEITTLRLSLERERGVAEAIAREEAFAAEQEQILRFQEERRRVEEELYNTTRVAILDEQTNALITLQQQYEAQLELARAYGLDTLEIEIAYQRLRTKAQSQFEEARQKESEEGIQAHNQAVADAYKGLGDIIQATLNLSIEAGSEYTDLSKALALIQIGVNSAAAISAAVAASAGIPFPGNLAAIGTAVLTVTNNILRARAILEATPEVPQRAEGGAVSVVGATDGLRYQAQPIGHPATGMLPAGGPVLVSTVGGPILANERGPEYFVAAHDMLNPQVFDHVRAIENLTGRHTLPGATPQMQEGGAITATAPTASTSDPVMIATLSQLAEAISMLRQGIPAYIPDRTIADMGRRQQVLRAASGG